MDAKHHDMSAISLSAAHTGTATSSSGPDGRWGFLVKGGGAGLDCWIQAAPMAFTKINLVMDGMTQNLYHGIFNNYTGIMVFDCISKNEAEGSGS